MGTAMRDGSGPGPSVRCFNVKYSANLGDGLLSECLEAALIGHGAAPDTRSIDLAGRTAYGEEMTGRGLVMSVLEALPGPLRQAAVRAPLAIQSYRKWAPHYAQALEGGQAASIGGGNLIADLDLNFPTKLSLAMEAADTRGLPVAIFACGMGGRWSSAGDRLVRQAMSRRALCAVFLRDAASKARWDDRFAKASGHEAVIVRDPGLLASEVYPGVERDGRDRPVVGLGIMSQIAIRYHADSAIGETELSRWYLDLAQALIAGGAEVIAFTNGSPEDVAAAEALRADLAALPGGGVDIVRPRTPAELAAIVARCDAIAAYRMHAIIAAYSFGVPALALSWDSKVDAFMASVGRQDWMSDPARLPAPEAARRLLQATEEGVDDAMRTTVLREARADVGRLFDALGAAVAAR